MSMVDNFLSAHAPQKPIVSGRVTIITAVFNAEHTLSRCIESVLGQDYHDVEYILMDGGSTDTSLKIISQYDGRITWRSEPDTGIYDAWNKSLALATGEWIAFLGADDFFFPGAITAYMDVGAKGEFDYISSQVRWVQATGSARTIGKAWMWPQFQSLMTTAHVGSMHRYTLFERYGSYDLSYRIVGDYEMLLRPRDRLRAAFMPLVTVEMQAGGASDSYAALAEAKRAKTSTGGRPQLIAIFEWWIASVKLFVRHSLQKRRLGMNA